MAVVLTISRRETIKTIEFKARQKYGVIKTVNYFKIGKICVAELFKTKIKFKNI